MSSRTVIVVLLALFCGASAAVGVAELRARSGQPADNGDRVPVVTVTADVDAGKVLTEKMLQISYYQDQNKPKGAIGSINEALGRVVTVKMSTGEPVLSAKLAVKGHGLVGKIPAGLRAFPITTPQLSGDMGGFLMSGNHVDVLLTTSPAGHDDQTGGGVTVTLLQDVPVLAVGPKVDAVDDGKPGAGEIKTVTLLVTPNQAETLNLGMNKGTLQLSLRGEGDGGDAKTVPVTMNDLVFHQEKPSHLIGDLLAAYSATAAHMPVEPAAAPKSNQAPAAEPAQQISYTEIQTLRGLDVGKVRIPLPR